MIYAFENTETGEIREVEMSMKNYKPYKGESGNEENWQRIYQSPQVNMGNSTSKSIDPWDNNSFVNRTKEMKGSYGEILEHAKELSDKRAKQSATGEDPIKRKYLDSYSKERSGKKHPSEMKKTVENKHIKIDL